MRDLKVFGRGNEEARGPVALRRVLDSSINIAWNEIRHRARLVKDYGDVPLIDGNESRLGQVFLNLLLNAAQAIPEGEAERNEIRVSTGTDGHGRVFVEVRDIGPRHRARDPSSASSIRSSPPSPTAWAPGSACGSAAASWPGSAATIAVESRLGHGSTFRVTLPPAPPVDEVDGPARGGPVAVERQGERRADHRRRADDPGRAAAARFGGDYQHHLRRRRARGAGAARAGERYDVVLCDLMMPEMSGMDLYAELGRLAPEQVDRMIFLTGGAFTPRAREFLEQIPNPRIEKPVDFQNLRALMKNLLR